MLLPLIRSCTVGTLGFSPCRSMCVIGDDGEEGEEDADDGGATSAEFILSPGLRLLVRGGAEVRAAPLPSSEHSL